MALLSFCRAAAGAAALAFFVGGCDFIHPPTYVPGDENQLLVHAVLEAGSDSAVVLVARVGPPINPVPVMGARVRLAGPGGEAVLAEVTGEPRPARCGSAAFIPGEGPVVANPGGCYAAAIPGGIVAGREYTLEVDVPGGEQVRGRTVVTLPPVVHAPTTEVRLLGDTTYYSVRAREPLPMRWSSGSPVGLRGWTERVWGREGEGGVCGIYLLRPEEEMERPLGDSVDVLVEAVSCMAPPRPGELRPDSMEVVLAITAFDSDYWGYIQYRENGIPREYASVGLQGAYGVFGSVAVAQRRLKLIAP
jgi:hypothetical protein